MFNSNVVFRSITQKVNRIADDVLKANRITCCHDVSCLQQIDLDQNVYLCGEMQAKLRGEFEILIL